MAMECSKELVQRRHLWTHDQVFIFKMFNLMRVVE